MSNEKTDSIVDINDLKALWRTFYKNWYIIISCIAVAYISAYFYTYKLTDVYAASTQILLKSNDAYDYQSIIQSGSSGMGGYKDYSENYNAMRVIKSYDLIKRTVDKLDLDVSYYIKGRLVTKEVYENIPFKINFTSINPMLYEQKMEFKIVDINKYTIKYLLGENEIIREGFFGKKLITQDLNLEILKYPGLHKSTIEKTKEVDYLIQFHSRASLVRNYQRAISVEIPEYSGIVLVTVEDIIPKRAITFLDSLGKVYIDNTLISKLDINSRTLTYIEKQLQELTDMMTSIEDRLQNYKQNEYILDLNKEQESYFNQLVTNQTELNKLDLLLSSLNSIENYIVEDKDPELVPPTMFLSTNDESLVKNVDDLYILQMERNKIKFSTTKSNPGLAMLDKQLEVKKLNLLYYINNSREAIKAQKAELKKQIDKFEGVITGIPIKQREVLSIERNLEVNQKMYSFLLQKKAENTIARAGIVPESKIIESALSIGIVKPNKTKITYTFIAVGFLISLLIIFVRTSFYETIETVEELKQKTNITILGEVMYSDNFESEEKSIDNNSRSPVVESFRTLRTNLQFMSNVDTGCQVYLLTSNHPSEGKTFCAVNLGALLAKGGRKVLLLELDLHKPRVYKALGMTNEKPGITSILVGKGKPEDYVLHTEVELLDVLLSGTAAPNASELILSKHMQDIIDFGKANYDYIIIDTPPVSLISDAIALMPIADVNIFVMNTKYPYKDSMNSATEIFTTHKPNNFCLVLNGVKRAKNNYYYRRYGAAYRAYSDIQS